jgi:hypothetical protein
MALDNERLVEGEIPLAHDLTEEKIRTQRGRIPKNMESQRSLQRIKGGQ